MRPIPSRRGRHGRSPPWPCPCLLSSLGTSIANVALPTLADVFAASFSEVQWVGARLPARRHPPRSPWPAGSATFSAGAACSWPASCCSPWPPSSAARRRRSGWLVAARAAARPGRRRPDGAFPRALSATSCPRARPAAPWVSSARLRRSAPRWARRSAAFLISCLGWRAIFRRQGAARASWLCCSPGASCPPTAAPAGAGAAAAPGLAGRPDAGRGPRHQPAGGDGDDGAPWWSAPSTWRGRLALDPARVGLAMSAGPLVAALAGLAGRPPRRPLGQPARWRLARARRPWRPAAPPWRSCRRGLGVAGYLVPVVVGHRCLRAVPGGQQHRGDGRRRARKARDGRPACSTCRATSGWSPAPPCSAP